MNCKSKLIRIAFLALFFNSFCIPILSQNLSYSKKATVPVLAKKSLALKPPLGWNSYDSYGNYIGEKETLLNLEIFAKKLAPHGYNYFVLDLGWYGEYACIPGSLRPINNAPFDFALDAYGYPVASRTYFPNGIKAIADRAHALGVKFGLHMMRGMIRKAWDLNLPVKDTRYRMRDIGDTIHTCSWANFTYGVDMSKAGAQEYYDGLIQHLADMGVDFIKYDDIVPYPAEMEAIGKAIAKCKRNIVLSLSPGDETTPANKSYYRWGNLLRITSDVWDSHKSIDACFTRWRDWQGQAEPGFWPDMDMLCLGTLSGMIDPLTKDARSKIPAVQLVRYDPDSIFFRPCHFTKAQERTFITMRALAASPMFMGGCLIRSEQRVFDLITNNSVLACNQNGICGTLQSEKKLVEIWRTPQVGKSLQGWIGVFNRNEKQSVMYTPTLKDLGLAKGNYRFRNIWTNEVFETGKPVTIGADDVIFLEYTINQNLK
jgi:alpha-galactosidase